MINWKKYFDQVFVLHYAGYTEIEDKLNAELARVGLVDSGILTIHNNISSPFLSILQRNVNCDNVPNDMQPSSFSCSFGHYTIMKIAELKQYRRILILEDDIVFLKDVDMIDRILETSLNEIPNYDVCMFSHFQSPCPRNQKDIDQYFLEMREAALNNTMFIPFTSSSAAVASGVSYGLSRRGILCLRGLYEHQMQIADMIFRNIPYLANGQIDGFHNEVLNMLSRFYCRYPISLQNNIRKSVTGDILGSNFSRIMHAQQQIAEQVGIHYNDYNFDA